MTSPIVIVGGGFAGLYTALELARRPGHPPLLLVEPRDRFVFLPFLYERLSGELPLWQMAPRYDALLASKNTPCASTALRMWKPCGPNSPPSAIGWPSLALVPAGLSWPASWLICCAVKPVSN